MAMTFNKRKKVKVCYERLGLILLGGITTIIVLNGYPTPAREEREKEQITFDIQDNGVVVVLDIANTGTDSLANYMIKNAVLNPPCQCQNGLTKCKCLNKQGQPWLFHAFNSTGYVCGEQADFTTLTNCPIDYWFRTSGRDSRPSRQYLLITMIREPLARYVSQWRSLTQEDMFFRNEPRLFRNQSVELQKKGLACYVNKNLSSLSLPEFLSCSQNGAINLQTRMLANMTFVDSLGLTGKAYQEAILNSAKRTLQIMPFFGLFSRPKDSLKLLESTLGIPFKQPFDLEDPAVQGVFPLPVSLQHQILQANDLDCKLYQHARFIFQERVKAVGFPALVPGNSGYKSLGGSDQIMYRPELHENVDVRSVPDITFDDNLPGNVVGVEKNINIDDDISEANEVTHDTNTKQGLVSHKDTRMETNEHHSDKDNDINKNIQKDKDERVIEGEVNNVPGFSGSRVELKQDSIDYNPDNDDVFVFLNRLSRIKQQEKEKDFIQSQRYLLPQKPILPTQQEAPQAKEPLHQLQQKSPTQSQVQPMQKQAQKKPGVASYTEQSKANKINKINKPLQQGHTFPGSENVPHRGSVRYEKDKRLHLSYILPDPVNGVSEKRGKSSHGEKSVNRMFH